MKKIILNLSFTVLIFLTVLTAPLNAQIEKKELKLTPEMEEMVLTEIKNMPEKDYAEYGITDRSQLMNLQLGKPIPMYYLINETLEFRNLWQVSVMSDDEPLFAVRVTPMNDGQYKVSGFNYMKGGAVSPAKGINNYEQKDLIIASVSVPSAREVDYLMIRKEGQDIFVQIYDEVTGEYIKGESFKDEYSLSELVIHLKEERVRYYDKFVNKSELKITPKITKMLIDQAYSSHINDSDESLSDWGIKERSQLEHLHLGKPIPMYRIVNENLKFIGKWKMIVMSDGEPLFFTTIKLEDNDQYIWAGSGAAELAEVIHNYEYKDFIIGCLWTRSSFGMDYLIIRKDNKDIFVQEYDYVTGEYLKNEYSFNEVLNLLKK